MNPLAATEISRLERLTSGLADPTDLDVAVHTTRKGIKRLRAFLRLARRSTGTSTYRIENGALRDTARLLAPARDAYVLVGTARDLDASDLVLHVLEEDYAAVMAALESVGELEVRGYAWQSPGIRLDTVYALREVASCTLLDEQVTVSAPRVLKSYVVRQARKSHEVMLAKMKVLLEGGGAD